MRVDDFDFHLPDDRIALEPVTPRDAARMLHVGLNDQIDRSVRDLPTILRPGDVLVVNDTKVLPAQLCGSRAARGDGPPITIDATLHKDLGNNCWRAFVRPAKRLRVGDVVEFGEGFNARVTVRDGMEAVLDFQPGSRSFAAALATYGTTPLPPYIARRRKTTEEDRERYQTVYARQSGSVAAPTAGLHFTDELMKALAAREIATATVTLHVGAGTFLPVSVDDARDHKMHAEWGVVSEATAALINERRKAGGRIVCVGTTSLRLLESAAQQGGIIAPFEGETDIFITPGYKIQSADLLLTNFHLPRSTLFMLVCAFSGIEPMKRAYARAIDTGYRFFSYGDATLLERRDD
ncbi:MAG: tRNA preQ1(34) S-adenosylmethionine ribosyltransferase-isomerase QueA [Pseudomonadota bacterium]